MTEEARVTFVVNKLFGYALSLTRLHRELPPGGSLMLTHTKTMSIRPPTVNGTPRASSPTTQIPNLHRRGGVSPPATTNDLSIQKTMSIHLTTAYGGASPQGEALIPPKAFSHRRRLFRLLLLQKGSPFGRAPAFAGERAIPTTPIFHKTHHTHLHFCEFMV